VARPRNVTPTYIHTPNPAAVGSSGMTPMERAMRNSCPAHSGRRVTRCESEARNGTRDVPRPVDPPSNPARSRLRNSSPPTSTTPSSTTKERTGSVPTKGEHRCATAPRVGLASSGD